MEVGAQGVCAEAVVSGEGVWTRVFEAIVEATGGDGELGLEVLKERFMAGGVGAVVRHLNNIYMRREGVEEGDLSVQLDVTWEEDARALVVQLCDDALVVEGGVMEGSLKEAQGGIVDVKGGDLGVLCERCVLAL